MGIRFFAGFRLCFVSSLWIVGYLVLIFFIGICRRSR